MRRGWFFGLTLLWSVTLCASGLEQLAERASQRLLTFFEGMEQMRVSCVALENHTDLNDMALQRFYQLLASRLEMRREIAFVDTLVHIDQGQGVFQTSLPKPCNFQLVLTLTEQGERIGLGIAVHSQRLERLVHIVYVEEPVPSPQRRSLETMSFTVTSNLRPRYEVAVTAGLLGAHSFMDKRAGTHWLALLYPQSIALLRWQENRWQEAGELPLHWGRPYYPAQDPIGRIRFFGAAGDIWLAAGCCQSPHTFLFRLDNETWTPQGKLEFFPFTIFSSGAERFWLGAPFAPGRNHFQGRWMIQPLGPDGVGLRSEREIPSFWDLAVYMDEDRPAGYLFLGLADNELRLYGPDWAPLPVPSGVRAGALAVNQEHYLLVNGWDAERERLLLVRIQNGQWLPFQPLPLNEEVYFIQPATTPAGEGFWVGCRRGAPAAPLYRLEFWGPMT